MSTYAFSAYGNVRTITPQDIATELSGKVGLIDDGLTALHTAYIIANRELLWNSPDSKEGCWMEQGAGQYYWHESNYFD